MADVVLRLKEQGADVNVVMTEHATSFVTPLTLQVLSQNPVYLNVLDEPVAKQVAHIALPQAVDVFCLAPASANVIAKIAHGIADDQLTSMVLALKPDTPKLLAPAMNTYMLTNEATVSNLALIEQRGWHIIPPRTSRLACGEVGEGVLATVETIVDAIIKSIAKSNTAGAGE